MSGIGPLFSASKPILYQFW